MNGSELRSAREKLGLTQEQLAAEFGYAKQAIGNWETGYRPVPKYVAAIVNQLLTKSRRRVR
jgi:transcriptional regulator with XRE-family HTH domain